MSAPAGDDVCRRLHQSSSAAEAMAVTSGPVTPSTGALAHYTNGTRAASRLDVQDSSQHSPHSNPASSNTTPTSSTTTVRHPLAVCAASAAASVSTLGRSSMSMTLRALGRQARRPVSHHYNHNHNHNHHQSGQEPAAYQHVIGVARHLEKCLDSLMPASSHCIACDHLQPTTTTTTTSSSSSSDDCVLLRHRRNRRCSEEEAAATTTSSATTFCVDECCGQLTALRRLIDAYTRHHVLREASGKLLAAYSASPDANSWGSQCRVGVSQARASCRQYAAAMLEAEAALQSMLGCLTLHMQELLGFARLCAGDVYEISVRCQPDCGGGGGGGVKVWRSRVTMDKDHSQRWTRTDCVLSPPSLCSSILIKAREVRSLGRRCLGSHQLSISDLLSAAVLHNQQQQQQQHDRIQGARGCSARQPEEQQHDQLQQTIVNVEEHGADVGGAGGGGCADGGALVVSLNTSGSVRLRLTVDWSPLLTSSPGDTTRLSQQSVSPSLSRQSSSSLDSSSASTPLPCQRQVNVASMYSLDVWSDSTSVGSAETAPATVSPSANAAGIASASAVSVSGGRSDSVPSHDRSRDSVSSLESGGEMLSPPMCGGADVNITCGCGADGQHKHHTTSTDDKTATPTQHWHCRCGRLMWACELLTHTALTRQMPTSLLSAVATISARLTSASCQCPHRRRRSSVAGGGGGSLKTRPDQLCFLHRRCTFDDESELDAGMTARTVDSGIASIVHRLSIGTDVDADVFSLSTAATVPTDTEDATVDGDALACSFSHSEQQDSCLEMHLLFCVKLAQGACTVSAAGRTHQLLCTHSDIVRAIVECETTDAASGPLVLLAADFNIQELWLDLCGQSSPVVGTTGWHIAAERAVHSFTQLLSPRLVHRDAKLPAKVANLLVCRCVDVSGCVLYAGARLSALSLHALLRHSTLDRVVEQLAEEVQLCDSLLSHNVETIERRLSQLVYLCPPAGCVSVLCRLLASAGPVVCQAVHNWLDQVAAVDDMVQQLVPMFVDSLESDSDCERRGAQLALHRLTTTTTITTTTTTRGCSARQPEEQQQQQQ